ncbi:MAG: cell division protein FtsL [Actinomycetota bacterium]|nr:cell division protein FtsL [Actinomycetota bacterium]HZY66209.1 cell division protein FtsL [Rubrobacteraceae bacterium]
MVLVLVPVLLMLGSVYLHTVAANLGEEALLLEEKYAGLLSEKERLQVEVSKLSAPDRIRSLARENLGMRSPGAEDMRVYDREDGKQDEGQPVQEDAR